MTITVTKLEVRPNTLVRFFNFYIDATPETQSYWHTNFVLTNKCLQTTTTFSEDSLTRTTVYIWNSLEDFDSFRNDPFVQVNITSKINDWNQQYGITRTIVIS